MRKRAVGYMFAILLPLFYGDNVVIYELFKFCYLVHFRMNMLIYNPSFPTKSIVMLIG